MTSTFFMFESYNSMAGQFFGFVSLILCVMAFSNKHDDRLFTLLISANIAFAVQFAFFESWTASALTALSIIRIALARRFPGSIAVMTIILAISGLASVLTWHSWEDIPAILAMVMGTVSMFLLRGISMRILLGLAGLAWMLSHILVGSVGGALAEAIVLFANAVTIYRIIQIKKRLPDVAIE